MAISIVAVLKSHGCVHQDALAKRFARRFERDPERGYGKMTRIQMREIMAGAKWRDTAANAFGGQGSMGNGSAMRVAPLGAYFADRLGTMCGGGTGFVTRHPYSPRRCGWRDCRRSCCRNGLATESMHQAQTGLANFFDAVLQHTPESKVRRGILLASTTPPEIPEADVAQALGQWFAGDRA